MPAVVHLPSSNGPQVRDRTNPYGPNDGGGGGGGGKRSHLGRLLCCPCRRFASLRPCDKFLCLACTFLMAMNVPFLVSKDESYRGREGLGRMHGKIREKLGSVNITAPSVSWDSLPSVSVPKVPNLPGLGALRGADDGGTEEPTLVPTAAPNTASPTASPTVAPTATKLEDPKSVAEKIAAQDLRGAHLVEWDIQKFPRPADCSPDLVGKVRSGGMDGSGCEGQPYRQQCCFSRLTTKHVGTWLDGYLEEIKELRSGKRADDDEDSTFVGAALGSNCDSLEGELRVKEQIAGGGGGGGDDSAAAAIAAKGALEHLLTKPKLFCSTPTSTEIAKRWGVVPDSAVDLSNLDKHLQAAGVHGHVKDALFLGGGEVSVKAIANGMVTLARTRYVEFDYDWRDSWASTSLKSIVEGLDEIGQTCYWAGEGKLWRISGCWQEFYGYRSWSHIACVNRNLAPKLAGRMEGMFKKTVGAE